MAGRGVEPPLISMFCFGPEDPKSTIPIAMGPGACERTDLTTFKVPSLWAEGAIITDCTRAGATCVSIVMMLLCNEFKIKSFPLDT